MVNSKNLFTAVVLLTAFAAVGKYVTDNNLSTSDISFIDACWKLEEQQPDIAETCKHAEQENIDWDTRIPCFATFRPDDYYFTPREFVGMESMSRKLKGEDSVEKRLFKLENPELQKNSMCEVTTKVREEFAEWAKSLNNTSSESDRRSLGLHDGLFYKACSTQPNFFLGIGKDMAECSGKTDHQCKNSAGTHGFWRRGSERGSRNKLNRGCVTHDECLAYSHKAGGCCDKDLSGAAWDCMWSSCSDSKFWSGIVWGIMKIGPNGRCKKKKRGGW